MKMLGILLMSYLFLSSVSCTTDDIQQNGGYVFTDLEPITVSRIAKTEEGKPYLEVDGKPFPVYGAQIRVDIFKSVDKLSRQEIESYFATAQELGINSVQVSYPWAFLEPKKDQWQFEEIDMILEFANKYDLKVELLWFSTNMIGDSYSWLVPLYILQEPSIRLKREGDAGWHGLYGYTYSLQMHDTWVLEREVNAVSVLFSHIREWDNANGNRHPVITCQVHNEPDALVRWRLDEKKISHKDGTMLTKKEAWDMTLEPLTTVGMAIQNSHYRVATRTNVISGDGVNDFPQTPGISPKDVYALQGIDFVSFDPYKEHVNEIAYEVSQYASLPGNYPLIAENRGNFANTASLMLVASSLGGGYDIYDLATSRYITSNSKPPFDSEGIYYQDLTPKPHVPQVKKLLKGLIGAAEDVALTSTENFAAFNIKTDYPQKDLSQTIRTTGAELVFKTSKGALAFVLDRGDELVAYATEDSELTVGNGTVTGGNNMTLKAGQVYRLEFKSSGRLTSTVKNNIGTIFN